MNQNVARLCEVVAAALNLPPEEVSPESSSSNLAAWNSLGHLDVILHVERAFRVRFKTQEMPQMDSIDALAKRLGLNEVA